MGVRYLAPCKNTDIVVDAIAEFAAGRRPAVSEMCITYAYGVSVRYTIIITERRKKKKKSGKENSDEGGILPRRKSLSDLSPTCSSRTLNGTQKSGHKDRISHDGGGEGTHAQYQDSVKNILLSVFRGHVQCMGENKRDALPCPNLSKMLGTA